MRITSGCRSAARVMASRPFTASPTTSMSGWAFSSTVKPDRTMPWSSATTTRMVTRASSGPLAPAERWRPAAARRSPGTRRRAVGPASRCPPSMAARSRMPMMPCPPPLAEPAPARQVRGALGAGRAVVPDLDHQGRLAVVQPHLDRDPGACRMALLSASCTIRYADRSTPAGAGRGVAGDAGGDRHPAGARRLQQPVQVVEAGLGRVSGRARCAARRAPGAARSGRSARWRGCRRSSRPAPAAGRRSCTARPPPGSRSPTCGGRRRRAARGRCAGAPRAARARPRGGARRPPAARGCCAGTGRRRPANSGIGGRDRGHRVSADR